MITALTEPRESRIVRLLEDDLPNWQVPATEWQVRSLEECTIGSLPTNDRQVRGLEDAAPNGRLPSTGSLVRHLEGAVPNCHLPSSESQVRVLEDSTNCGKLPMSGSQLLPPDLSHRLGSCGSWKREPVVPCPPTSAKSAHARQPNALAHEVVA